MNIKKNKPFLHDDVWYMQKAIAQAHYAYKKNEVPIGAIIVASDGTIVARAHNLVEQKVSQTAHAEMQAIAKATKKLGDWRLEGHTIYVTLEPCSMCMGLILLSRLEVVVFAVPSKLFGFSRDQCIEFNIDRCPILIKEGVCHDEALSVLQGFFKEKREEKSVRKKTRNQST